MAYRDVSPTDPDPTPTEQYQFINQVAQYTSPEDSDPPPPPDGTCAAHR